MRTSTVLSLSLVTGLLGLAAACASSPNTGPHPETQALQAQVDDLGRELASLHNAIGADQPRLMGEYWSMLQRQLSYLRHMPGVESHDCKDWVLVAPLTPDAQPARAIKHCPAVHDAGPASGWQLPPQMAPQLFELTMQQQLDRLRTQVGAIGAETDAAKRLDLLRAHYETRYQDIQTVLGRGWMWTSRDAAAFPDPHSLGAQLVGSYCSQCHAAPTPDLYTEAEWRGITGRMHGIIRTQSQADIMGIRMPAADEFDLIVSYLESHARSQP